MEVKVFGKKHQGRKFFLKQEIEVGENTQKHLKKNGWDGKMYILSGSRSALFSAHKSATTGDFHIVINLRGFL